jgi:hypothetical protein
LLIRPIRKRPRQKTPESFSSAITPSLPLRPTKLITTSTPTVFNNSQVDESDSEEENTLAQVISKSESEKESENEEEDNITYANKYLDQDLNKELGLDRLNKKDTDESDAENKVSKEFKISKFFSQSVIGLKGKLSFKLPSEKVVNLSTFSTYSTPFKYIITNL